MRTTTQAKVDLYAKVHPVFTNLLHEVQELSKKKPDLAMSKLKVSMINRVLTDVMELVADEPQSAYTDLLDDVLLPQNSDAVLVMVQHEAALRAFYRAYYNSLESEWRVKGKK